MKIRKIATQLKIERPQIPITQKDISLQKYIGRKITQVMSQKEVSEANKEVLNELGIQAGDCITPVREMNLNRLRENYYQIISINGKNQITVKVLDSNRVMENIDLFGLVETGAQHGKLMPRWKKTESVPEEFRQSKSVFNLYKFSAEQKQLFIMRGLPGSGKSTLAKELSSGGEIFSTDDFFIENGVYNFDPQKLPEAHEWNLNRTIKAMRDGITPIVVDNTNTQGWEAKSYVENAAKFGYSISIREPSTPWKFDREIPSPRL